MDRQLGWQRDLYLTRQRRVRISRASTSFHKTDRSLQQEGALAARRMADAIGVSSRTGRLVRRTLVEQMGSGPRRSDLNHAVLLDREIIEAEKWRIATWILQNARDTLQAF